MDQEWHTSSSKWNNYKLNKHGQTLFKHNSPLKSPIKMASLDSLFESSSSYVLSMKPA